MLVFNDTNVAKNIHLMYADEQDGNRVWIERVRYTDGLPEEVVPAHSSRPPSSTSGTTRLSARRPTFRTTWCSTSVILIHAAPQPVPLKRGGLFCARCH